MHKLFKINISTDDDGIYRFTPDADSRLYGAKEFSVKANEQMLLRFLRRCKVADCSVEPRSYRSITYKEIVQYIIDNKGDLYIFAHMYPKSHEDILRSLS